MLLMLQHFTMKCDVFHVLQPEKKVAPEHAEFNFHLNVFYLIFKFPKPVQKAIRGKECQSFTVQRPAVNIRNKDIHCNKSPDQQTAQ